MAQDITQMTQTTTCPHCGDVTEQMFPISEYVCGKCDKIFRPDYNIVKLQNLTEVKDPIACARSGTITLSYNVEDRDTVELEGSITLSEACFLYMKLGQYLNSELGDEP